MQRKRKAGVYTAPGRKPWPHEERVANILALAGHYIEFLPENNRKTADILIDGKEFEIKSPEGFNANTFDHTIRDALKQAPNLVIDSSRIKKVRDDKIRSFLISQVRKNPHIKGMLFITKKGQIVDIFALI